MTLSLRIVRLFPLVILVLFITGQATAAVDVTELDRIYPDSSIMAATNDNFGWDVDVDGDRAVIGARGTDTNANNSGSAYVYLRNSGSGFWEFEEQLFAPAPQASDNFGNSVAIDGDTIVVGRPNNCSVNLCGAAYVFTRVEGVGWGTGVELQPLDSDTSYQNFGIAVDIDNDTIVVGVNFDNDQGQASGSAYVFEKSGGTWSRTAKLLPPSSGTNQNFGTSVAIDQDTIAIGAAHWTVSGLGAAYVFTRAGGWDDATATLPVADNTSGDQFGWSIAVSGDLVVVGARYDDDAANGVDSGSATIFDRSSGNWVNEGKLTASDGQTNDHFGWDVATNGEAVVVGAPDTEGPLVDVGAFYVFSDSGSGWLEDALTVPSTDATFTNIHEVGTSTALSGETLFVGAHGTDIFINSTSVFLAGAAFIYEVAAQPTVIADYGDAPLHNVDSYHEPGELKLGELKDTESAAQVNATATGDDNDGIDDEDGVFFRSAFIKGDTTYIEVIASAAGYLNAWADFGNGWDDPSEHIFTDQALVAGSNELSFAVPNTGTEGENAALRFRFSSQTGLAASGAAPDGEVEDYVMVRKDSADTDPDNDGVDAATEDAGPNGGDGNNDGIPDSQQLNVTSLPNAADGQYIVIESQPGTFLTGVSSVDPDSLATPPAGTSFPLGALQFNIEGIAPGATVQVEITFPPEVLISSYYKFDGEWYDFFDNGDTGAAITPGKIVLTLRDGGRGDNDYAVNGVIEDPGAPTLDNTAFEDGFEAQ